VAGVHWIVRYFMLFVGGRTSVNVGIASLRAVIPNQVSLRSASVYVE
jgi:hypothetical protein